MRYEIFNGSRRDYAYRADGGLIEVAPGETVALDVMIADGVKALQEARGVVFRPVEGQEPEQDAAPAGGASGAQDGDKDKMKTLRADYRALTGKNPGPRWDVETLKAKIAEAKG
jgi:hypothetical protein